MTDRFIAACIQMNSGSQMQENITTAEKLTREAAGQGATFVVLPENVALMKESGTSYDSIAFHEGEHPFLKAAQIWAKELGIYLLIGSVAVKRQDTHLLSNRSLLVSPQGEVIARYDKIHLFDVSLHGDKLYHESKHFLHGDTAIVATMPWGCLGMTICYDVRFPQLYRALAKAGAGVITVPAAFTRITGEAHWHVLLRARAIETGCFILAAAQSGSHPGDRETYGHALIIDPWGNVLADAGTAKEAVILSEINLGKVTDVRSQLPSLHHDRAFNVKVIPLPKSDI